MTEHKAINKTAERAGGGVNGILVLLVSIVLLGLGLWLVIGIEDNTASGLAGIVAIVVAALAMCGFYALQPNEASAITLFGNYKGTDRNTGLRWVLPWYGRKKISMRV